MSKCNRDNYPSLFKYLDAYGLDEGFVNRIDRIKGRDSTGYHVVGALYPDGEVCLLDISSTPDRMMTDYRDGSPMSVHGWNMMNDTLDSITEKDWNKIRIWPYCEGFTIKGHPIYGEEGV